MRVSKEKIIEGILFIFVLSIAIFFRFYNLKTIPSWYVDEGWFIRAAQNVMHGNWSQTGVEASPYFLGRPMFFIYLLAIAFKVFGVDIIVLRVLVGVIGLATTGLLYIGIRQILDSRIALGSALVFSILPRFVFYGRIGFTYHLLTFFIIAWIFALYRFQKSKTISNITIVSVLSGLALATDYGGILIIMITVTVIVVEMNKKVVYALGLMILPLAIVWLPYLIYSPNAVLYDVQRIISFKDPTHSVNETIFHRLVSSLIVYGELIRINAWVLLGLFGIWLIENKLFRRILFVTGFSFLLFSYITRIPDAQYLIPVFPIFAIGLGKILSMLSIKALKDLVGFFRSIEEDYLPKFLPKLLGRLFSSLSASILFVVIIFLPVLWFAIFNFIWLRIAPSTYAFVEILNVRNSEGFSNSEDILKVIDYVEPKLSENEYIITSPHVGWLVNNNAVGYVDMAVFTKGGDVMNLQGFDFDRFERNGSLEDAKFFVVDDWWTYWALENNPEFVLLSDQIRDWPLVFSSGSIFVHCNPKFCSH